MRRRQRRQLGSRPKKADVAGRAAGPCPLGARRAAAERGQVGADRLRAGVDAELLGEQARHGS